MRSYGYQCVERTDARGPVQRRDQRLPASASSSSSSEVVAQRVREEVRADALPVEVALEDRAEARASRGRVAAEASVGAASDRG